VVVEAEDRYRAAQLILERNGSGRSDPLPGCKPRPAFFSATHSSTVTVGPAQIVHGIHYCWGIGCIAWSAQFDPQGRFRDVEVGGNRDGFLNLGGFLQYTLIEDVEDQFLLTGGVRWAAPCGSHEVFQGKGPGLMAPYFTAGKEFGEFHVLATGGYQFPFAGSGKLESDLFYGNVHLDRRCFGWLYPLVEFDYTLPRWSSEWHLQGV
jgi:hypothetical protein